MGTNSILNSMKSLLRTWTNKQRWFSLINLLVDFESDVSLWRFIILLVYSHPIIKIIKMRRGLNVCLLLLFLPKKNIFSLIRWERSIFNDKQGFRWHKLMTISLSKVTMRSVLSSSFSFFFLSGNKRS